MPPKTKQLNIVPQGHPDPSLLPLKIWIKVLTRLNSKVVSPVRIRVYPCELVLDDEDDKTNLPLYSTN